MKKLSEDEYTHGGTQLVYYKDEQKENCLCPFCNANDSLMLGSERGLAVVKCKKCKLIYTNPRAKNTEQNYFGDEDTFLNECKLIFLGKKTSHRDKNYEYEIRQIKKHKKSGKLLDIGTNAGFFLRKARDFGFATEGVEPSPSLSKMAKEQWGLKVHNSFLEHTNLPKNTYDVITLIDVFEHITNPKELLNKSLELLKDDGIVVIKVPNGDYNHFKMKLAKLTGKQASMDVWNCCEHVVHYTPETFNNMIQGCGFKIKTFFIPIPIHPPVWAHLVGHYYQYPSPFVLDWKRIVLRTTFFYIGKIEKTLGFKKISFAPDLMFIIEKK